MTVGTTQVNKLHEITEGIYGSEFGMHSREVRNAAMACQRYLGLDTLLKSLTGKTDQPSLWEVYYAPEVTGALNIVALETAHEAGEVFSLTDSHRKALQDPELSTRITGRFPEVDAKRIEKALTL